MSKHEKMIDNTKVKDNHQQGIERVLQRKGEENKGYEQGKMYARPKEKANWRRSGGSLTPRQA